MMCLLALNIHCSVISLSIGKSIGIDIAIQLSGIIDIVIADIFLNEYRYHYWRYFCKVSLTTLATSLTIEHG
jgi:hypothetical protein